MVDQCIEVKPKEDKPVVKLRTAVSKLASLRSSISEEDEEEKDSYRVFSKKNKDINIEGKNN